MEQRLRRAVFDKLEMLSEQAGSSEPGRLAGLARSEIRRLTDGWRQLLASHQPDDDGRCPRCSGWLRRRRWPCPVWLVAHHQLVGEGVWHEKRPKRPSAGPFGKRNPTVVIRRQLPGNRPAPRSDAGGSAAASPAGRSIGVYRAAVVERGQRSQPDAQYRTAS